MRKFFNVVMNYALPIVIILSSIFVYVKTAFVGKADLSLTILSIVLGAVLILSSIREKRLEKRLKERSNVEVDVLVSDQKDNGFLTETHPLELNNTVADNINELVGICFSASYRSGWHTDKDGKLFDRNRAEMLCLIHSEISEAMEGERKVLMDDHLPDRLMAEVELADAVIRIADYCGRFGYDLGGAIVEKLEYNANRADHKRENRELAGGKKF